MCISCRQRDAQNRLVRLQCINGSIESFRLVGRSFYVCQDCISDEKKVLKSLMRQCKSGDKEIFLNKLKEIIVDDRKS